MREWIAENPMTFMLVIAFGLVAVVGGVVVIVEGENTLSFEDYLNNLKDFAIALGIFGAGKAIKNGLKSKEDDDFDPAGAEEEALILEEAGGVPSEAHLAAEMPEEPEEVLREGDPQVPPGLRPKR